MNEIDLSCGRYFPIDFPIDISLAQTDKLLNTPKFTLCLDDSGSL